MAQGGTQSGIHAGAPAGTIAEAGAVVGAGTGVGARAGAGGWAWAGDRSRASIGVKEGLVLMI